jgi:hypothetical protein
VFDRHAKGVANNSSLILVLNFPFSPLSLVMLPPRLKVLHIVQVGAVVDLEVLYFHLELVSVVLVLDLIKLGANLAIPVLLEESLTLLLNDELLDIVDTNILCLKLLALQDLLLELWNIFKGIHLDVSFNFKVLCSVATHPENLSLRNRLSGIWIYSLNNLVFISSFALFGLWAKKDITHRWKLVSGAFRS